MNAIAYYRVGRTGQAFDAQRQQVQAHAKQRGLTILAEHQDTGSTKGPRPGWDSAEEQAAKEDAPIVVASLDRAAREASTLESLREDGVKVDPAT